MEYNMNNTHTAGTTFAEIDAMGYKVGEPVDMAMFVTCDGFRVYTHLRRNDAGELIVLTYIGQEVREDDEMVDIIDVRTVATHVPESVDTSNVGH